MARPNRNIYFEHQKSTNLCGLHALNNLLQGPIFSAAEMIDFVQQMNSVEAANIQNPRDRMEHADNSGNFSMEVISLALKNLGIEMVNLNSEEGAVFRFDLPQASAYFCHLGGENVEHHYIVLRRISQQWYRFDSLHDGPVPMSETYLVETIAQIQQEGFTVYVMDADLSAFVKEDVPAFETGNQDEEDELQQALALSLAESQGASVAVQEFQPPPQERVDEEDEELKRALALSLADVPSKGGSTESQPASDPQSQQVSVPASAPEPTEVLKHSTTITENELASSSSNAQSTSGVPNAAELRGNRNKFLDNL